MIFRYIQCYIPTHVSNNIEFLYIHNYSQSWFESYWHAGVFQTIIMLSSCVPIIQLLECKSYGGIGFFYLILTAYWGESEHLSRIFPGSPQKDPRKLIYLSWEWSQSRVAVSDSGPWYSRAINPLRSISSLSRCTCEPQLNLSVFKPEGSCHQLPGGLPAVLMCTGGRKLGFWRQFWKFKCFVAFISWHLCVLLNHFCNLWRRDCGY